MKKCSTVSFEGQVIFVGIDVHKESWVVNLRHCHRELDKFSMNPCPEMLAKYLRKNYPGAEYRSVYEAGFCGFWAHRRLCELGIQNIVINPADVPTSGKERDRKNDAVDSRKLARELENRTLEGIYVPPEDNLELRNLVRRETKLTGNITRVKNRIKGHVNFMGLKFEGWSGRSLKIMYADAEKRHDYALQSMLRELRFLREEKLHVIRDERQCLKRLKRDKIQGHLQSIPGVGFHTAVMLQAELWDLQRFEDKDALSSYVGLAPRLVGSGEHEVLKSVRRVYQRGTGINASTTMKQVLLGSRDLDNWFVVSSSSEGRMEGFSGTGYRYYIVIVSVRLKAGDRLIGLSADIVNKYTSRLR